MDPNHYRFRDVWRLAAPAPIVYAALEDVQSYPLWWPEVREARPTGEDSGDVVLRALLPYRLVVGLVPSRRDPAAGVLEVTMRGDLNGWTRCTVTPDGPRGAGSRVLFEEDARPGRPLLRRFALPLHPLFRANHAVMMRRGQRGLAAYLAGRGDGSGGGSNDRRRMTADR
ncbi:SRPBCC family protein [Kitasatospora sp. NPDC001547]|uniref:SRPBCC family protein n=1 Tax=Kitasatospora sp. NPDC001547 TaxID=3364015 RepID=UPI0036C44AAD|nr:SRPBCC family protein [Kitasatospora sp. Xyl93]